MKNRITLIPLVAIALAAGSVSADPTSVKLSSIDRSIFFRDGKGTRGKAGFNGGHYSDKVFDGNFTNYAYQNAAGAELVIPTTDTTTGAAYFVTDFIVGHKGNTRYSLYYTTEAEPATILSNAKDPRNWTKIDGATDVTFAGIRTNGVNVVATAVKYVFDTTEEWVTSLGEVEVWGVDPTELGCLHQHKTEWEAIPATANCTGRGLEQQQCLDCGEWFYRDSATILPLGHKYETVLVKRGTSLAYGSGTNVCKRCGHEIAFPEPRDLIALGGVVTPGIVQFTDVSVSSTGNPSYGVNAEKLYDGQWHFTWGNNCPMWYANGLSGEYVDYAFATAVDLTSVEFSVHNHNHIVQFYSLEPDGSEVLVGEEAIIADNSANAQNYQRKTVEFRGVTLSTLRIRFNDSIGVKMDAGNVMLICELHPYGTVAGAGKSAAVRTRVIID